MNMGNEHFMDKAIKLAVDNVKKGGGPFGAIIVKDGEMVASGTNRVTSENDPTAHAEVKAIREACRKLRTFDLSGCTIYTSCEPCPMCFSAIYWAHLDAVYYAADHHDAAKAGFDDAFIYDEIKKQPDERKISFKKLDLAQHFQPFGDWIASENKTKY